MGRKRGYGPGGFRMVECFPAVYKVFVEVDIPEGGKRHTTSRIMMENGVH